MKGIPTLIYNDLSLTLNYNVLFWYLIDKINGAIPLLADQITVEHASLLAQIQLLFQKMQELLEVSNIPIFFTFVCFQFFRSIFSFIIFITNAFLCMLNIKSKANRSRKLYSSNWLRNQFVWLIRNNHPFSLLLATYLILKTYLPYFQY